MRKVTRFTLGRLFPWFLLFVLFALLPALPAAWPNGRVKGLCARGAFEVDIAWRDGKLVSAAIRSKAGGHCAVRCGGKTSKFVAEAGKSYALDADLKCAG